MAAPHNPNTAAATETRKLKTGEASISHRIRGSHDLHKWLAGLTPTEIGGLLDQIRQSM